MSASLIDAAAGDINTTTTATEEKNNIAISSTGGIAWSGSLVGSTNPNPQLGYRTYNPNKRRYRAIDEDDGTNPSHRSLPSNIQIQLYNRQGVELGTSVIDIPIHSTVSDLTALVHTLLETDGDSEDKNIKIPYSFYAKIKPNKKNSNKNTNKEEDDEEEDDVEVTISLKELYEQYSNLSTESTLQIIYQPLSIYKVRPISRCTDTLSGHTEAVLHVTFSPASTLLASGGGDAVVRFWDINTNMPKFNGKGEHKNHVLCTAWSSDNKKFASGDKNGVLILWDPLIGKPNPSKHIQAHKQFITCIVFEPYHCTSSLLCDKVATASKDSTIKIWNCNTGSPVRTLSGHTDSVECIKWSGENVIYSASRDRTIKVWNVDRGILIRTLTGHGHRINTLALSTDYVLRTGPFCNLFNKDNSNNNLKKKQQEYIQSPEKAKRAAKENYEQFKNEMGSTERLVSGSDDFTLFIWNPMESKHPIKRLTGHQQAVNHIVFSPDGRYFASASFDKKIKLWNGISGDYITTFTGHVGAVYQLTWSPDSRYLVSASKDATAKLWDISNGKAAKETLPGHADEVYALDWSPNGSSVATGSKDRTIKIWKH